MRFPSDSKLIIINYLGILLAFFFLLFGIPALIWPDVPDQYLAQNTRNSLTLILTAVVLIYTLFRPYSGGIILCISAILISYVFSFHPIWITFGAIVLLIGVLSIIRSRLSQRKALEDSEDTL